MHLPLLLLLSHSSSSSTHHSSDKSSFSPPPGMRAPSTFFSSLPYPFEGHQALTIMHPPTFICPLVSISTCMTAYGRAYWGSPVPGCMRVPPPTHGCGVPLDLLRYQPCVTRPMYVYWSSCAPICTSLRTNLWLKQLRWANNVRNSRSLLSQVYAIFITWDLLRPLVFQLYPLWV